MGEHHEIAGPAHGEPQPADHVGALVRVPLDSPPTPKWSRLMTAHLAVGLTGHPAIGHLRLSDVVQGCDIVLQGVETREAGLLGPVLVDAIDAANHSCALAEDDLRDQPLNMDPVQAEQVAQALMFGTEARRQSGRSSAPTGGA